MAYGLVLHFMAQNDGRYCFETLLDSSTQKIRILADGLVDRSLFSALRSTLLTVLYRQVKWKITTKNGPFRS